MAAGNGDFRWPKVQALMAEADVVVTNPPFSLFREFIDSLMNMGVDFLLLGNYNAVSYKKVFGYFVEGRLNLGINAKNSYLFEVPAEYVNSMGNAKTYPDGRHYCQVNSIGWFTTIEHGVKPKPLVLTQKYDPAIHPKYDNYDAIEVSRLKQIPYDYFEPMGVPITYLARHDPDGFEIVEKDLTPTQNVVYIAGKAKYGRVMIQRKAEFHITGLGTSTDLGEMELDGKSRYARIIIQRKAQFDITGLNTCDGKYLYLAGQKKYDRIVIQRKLDDTGPVV